MASYTGKLRHNDLEGGFFELVTDGGDTYRLEGGKGLSDGQSVRITGTVESGGFGLHMTGAPTLVVDKVEPA